MKITSLERAKGLSVRRSQIHGAALVATLALVLLLTFVLIAFLSRATSNRQIETAEAGSQKADLLARSALQVIMRDLRQEMLAGSTNYVSSGVSIFQPVTNTAAIPYRALAPGISTTDTNFYALAKQSGTNAMFPSTAPYTNNSATAMIIGSAITTDMVSANGHLVSGARWNAPYLTANGFTASNQLPTWVFLTRAGIAPSQAWNSQFGNSTQSNPNYVVGRFAYTIYDESGLLDINAAGYPSSLSPSQAASLKYTLMGTALAQIPGVLDSDALIQWRNGTNAASAISYTNAAAEEATNGFLTPLPGDNQYLSRQDLINYAQANPTVLSTKALQYLTTFTRELNAPSWGPDRDATNMGSANNAVTAINGYSYAPNANGSSSPAFNYAYADNANTYREYNRFIPNIRIAQAATVTDYATSGTNYTYNVNAGDPLVQRRFSLDKLSWITSNGPGKTSTGATPSAAAIQACFGLAWDSTHNVWDYVGPNGNNIQTWIETLDDVGHVTGTWNLSGLPMVDMTPRPPNFFELLKGGILSGSLGLYANNNSNLGFSYFAGGSGGYTALPDIQALQIGANLIDQCSPAATPPICIMFGYSTSYESASNGPIYGSKSLPLINKLVFSVERPKNQNDEANFWVEFEMWNPYADAAVATLPSSFRIVFGGDPTPVSSASYDITMPLLPPAALGGSTLGVAIGDYRTGTSWTWEPAVPWLSNTTTSSGHAITVSGFTDKMAEPIMLDQVRRDGATVNSGTGPGADASEPNDVYNGAMSSAYQPAAALTENPPPTATGFWLGERYLDSVDLDPSVPPSRIALYSPAPGTTSPSAATDQVSNGSSCDAAFYLQYNYGGTWRTVQVIHELRVNAADQCSPAANSNVFTDIRYKQLGFGLVDPRTDRFGLQVYSLGNCQYDQYETVSPNTSTSPTSQYWGNSIFGDPTNPSTQWYTADTLGNANLFQPWNGPQGNAGEAFRYADNTAPVANGGGPLLYQDLDGVQRPGDSVWNSSNPSQGVYPLATAFPNNARTGANGYATDRPVMLNRPFQNVGEMAYAFRGTPWRSLDLSSTNSADAALMDLFCVGDDALPMHAGRINPNRASPATLAALIDGANQDVLNGTYLNTTNAVPVATAISAALQAAPAMSKAQLLENLPSGTLSTDVSPIKSQKEGVVRAIADVSQVRTWNLLVDVVAQSGRYSPIASAADQFIVEGERRYWLHLAIDRFTGQVVDQQLEPVNE